MLLILSLSIPSSDALIVVHTPRSLFLGSTSIANYVFGPIVSIDDNRNSVDWFDEKVKISIGSF